ncbi:hypothetical protein WA026_009721 [Henosepilachna vigintioctopunctata]|uniref:Uncharacterized protein n=1 Tax=Henosepilachna vigintioctopunctata TaxID=420089 RepID=A0AAW1TKV4_9CUCU
MFPVKYSNVLIFTLLILVQIKLDECKRTSGGSRARPSRPRPAPTHRPYTQAPTARPYTQSQTRAPTYRPFPQPAPTYRPQPAPTYRPQPVPTYRPQPQPGGRNPTYRPATQPGGYPTQQGRFPTPSSRYPQGPPAYPGAQPGGYRPTYVQPNYQNNQRTYQIPQAGGKTKVKVYNINNYHSPGYYAPMSYRPYSYTSSDTGSGVLGFFLGYSLAKITSPSYYRCHTCYDGYSPRYDHYTVHHYYHNSGNVPKQQTVTTNNIITCGDSSQICPANTAALCTASGQIMCVVAVTNTVPCDDKPGLKCVKSSVPCADSNAPECKGIPKGQAATVSIPCISNTVIQGNITTVNNTIISAEPPKNNTQQTVETTTMPSDTFPSLGSNGTFPSLGSNATQSRAKRQVDQPYCVTVLAEPSVRKDTEGETVFNEVTSVFDKFFSNAFGIGYAQKKAK